MEKVNVNRVGLTMGLQCTLGDNVAVFLSYLFCFLDLTFDFFGLLFSDYLAEKC